ncbi:MAG: S1C family serine protease [Pseudomonadota bacterium]
MRPIRRFPPLHLQRWIRWSLTLLVLASAGALAAADEPAAGAAPADPAAEAAQSRALGRASDAVVGVRTLAVTGARSADTLGPARQGSGVVIDRDDLVLTIGYLILEADQVQLLLDDGRELPARVVAYDVATGFGLVQSLAPTRLEPVPLGQAGALAPDEPLMVVSGGKDGGISLARLVSQRPFSGYWEYHIDGALFTAPARMDHSGAALFNARGELLGIGALFVHNALGEDAPRLPGNMFVPVDLLKPILQELRVRGSSAQSRRAWIGVNCVELNGAVRVVRVSTDGPADLAGVLPGDRIVRIDGNDVGTLGNLWKLLWAGGHPERVITLDIERGTEAKRLTLKTVDRMTMLKHAEGI